MSKKRKLEIVIAALREIREGGYNSAGCELIAAEALEEIGAE